MDPNNDAASKEAQIATREAEKLSGEVLSLKIKKEADLGPATELLTKIKSTAKDIEKRRKEITQPLNLALKSVNALFKEPADKLNAAEDLIKKALLEYQQKVDRAAQKKIGKIEGQVDAGEMEMSDAMDKLGKVKQGPQNIQAESGGAHFQGRKQLKIVDISQIPQRYFLRDRVLEAVRLEVAEDVRNGAPLPPGAEYVTVTSVVVRTAK